MDIGSVGRRDGGDGRQTVLLRLGAVLGVALGLAGWRRVRWDWLVMLNCGVVGGNFRDVRGSG